MKKDIISFKGKDEFDSERNRRIKATKSNSFKREQRDFQQKVKKFVNRKDFDEQM